MIKKTVCTILFLVLLLNTSLMISAEEIVDNGIFVYKITDNTVSIIDQHNAQGDIIIPDTLSGYPVIAISDFVYFSESSITSVVIPDSVSDIGRTAFADCAKLQAINVSANNPYFTSEHGVLYNKDMTELLTYPAAKSASFVVPDSVITIGTYAFYNNKVLTDIYIPDSVENIGAYAFYYCSILKNVRLPYGLTRINDYVFYCCLSLSTENLLPQTVTAIGDFAFYQAKSPEKFIVPNHVVYIGNYAFARSEIQTIVIQGDVDYIGAGAFYAWRTMPMDVYIYGRINTIDYKAFNNTFDLIRVYFYDDAPKQWIGGFSGYHSSWNPFNIEPLTICYRFYAEGFEEAKEYYSSKQLYMFDVPTLYFNPTKYDDSAIIVKNIYAFKEGPNEFETYRLFADLKECNRSGILMMAIFNENGTMDAVYTAPIEQYATKAAIKLLPANVFEKSFKIMVWDNEMQECIIPVTSYSISTLN